jgi:Zn-finger nucleic acid-binding protein
MQRQKIGTVEVDRCAGCAGLWLDALEKEKLLERPGLAAEADRPGAHAAGRPGEALTCPRDRSTLIRMVDRRQPHVGFESCTVCGGVFLDAGELADLSELTLRERVRGLFG